MNTLLPMLPHVLHGAVFLCLDADDLLTLANDAWLLFGDASLRGDATLGSRDFWAAVFLLLRKQYSSSNGPARITTQQQEDAGARVLAQPALATKALRCSLVTQHVFSVHRHPVLAMVAWPFAECELQGKHLRDHADRRALRVLIRARPEKLASNASGNHDTGAPPNMRAAGHWARAHSLLAEADVLFDAAGVPPAERFLVPAEAAAAPAEAGIVSFTLRPSHGWRTEDDHGRVGVYNAFASRIVPACDPLEMTMMRPGEVCDSVSPLIANPFRYFLPCAERALEAGSDAAYAVLYPRLHPDASRELLAWYVAQTPDARVLQPRASLLGTLQGLADLARRAPSLRWFTKGGEHWVTAECGLDALDLLAAQSVSPTAGLLFDPMKYVKFGPSTCGRYAAPTLRTRLDPDTVCFRGPSLALEIGFVEPVHGERWYLERFDLGPSHELTLGGMIDCARWVCARPERKHGSVADYRVTVRRKLPPPGGGGGGGRELVRYSFR